MKILILVIASRGEVYDQLVVRYWKRLIEVANKTRSENGIDVILLYGDSDVEDLGIPNRNLLKIEQVVESWMPGIFLKTIEAIKLMGDSYDYVYRTNLSSFLRIRALRRLVRDLPRRDLYAGKRVTSRGGSKFATGSGFLISRDVARRLVERSLDVSGNECPDDVLIGKLLADLPITPLRRFDLVRQTRLPSKGSLKEIVRKIKERDHYHIRIKNRRNRLRFDLMIVEYLVNRFY
jgi:hypothetical protein